MLNEGWGRYPPYPLFFNSIPDRNALRSVLTGTALHYGRSGTGRFSRWYCRAMPAKKNKSPRPLTGGALLRRRGRRRYTHGRAAPCITVSLDGHRPSSTAGTPSVHTWTGTALHYGRSGTGRLSRWYCRAMPAKAPALWRATPFFDGGDAVGTHMDGRRPALRSGDGHRPAH